MCTLPAPLFDQTWLQGAAVCGPVRVSGAELLASRSVRLAEHPFGMKAVLCAVGCASPGSIPQRRRKMDEVACKLRA